MTTTVRSWPGCAGGVLTPGSDGQEDLPAYRAAGGYRLAGVPAPRVHDDLAARAPVRALRGRGGAWYPFWAKVTAVAAAAADTGLRPYVVANGAEGEPLSVKDRYLMRHRPHLVLDGVALAAASAGATEAVLYVTDAASLAALETAASDASRAGIPLPSLRLVRAQDTYVAGEATAAVRAIDTGIARPRDTDFRLARSGLAGAPTLLSNVETLARLARAVLPEPPAGHSPLLLTVSGPGIAPSLIEVDYGLPVTELITHLTGASKSGKSAQSVLIGGFFGGIVPAADGLRLTVESAAAHGGALGVASLFILGERQDPCAVAAAVAAYYAANNARQCRFCNEATTDIAAALAGDTAGTAGAAGAAGAAGTAGTAAADPAQTVRQLTRWSASLPGRGACSLPDGIAALLGSLLRHYPERLTEYLTTRPPAAPARATGEPAWSGFTVPVPETAGRGRQEQGATR